MPVSWINRETLRRQLQRVAQRKALVVMGSALATLIVFALVLSLVESLIGRDLVGYAFVIAFFGVPMLVDLWLTRTYCRRSVLCPNCKQSLWSCATANFKPRKVRIRNGSDACPSCGTPIR